MIGFAQAETEWPEGFWPEALATRPSRLAAVGYNFRRLPEWPALVLCVVLGALNAAAEKSTTLEPA